MIKVLREVDEDNLKKYAVIIHLPAYDSDDEWEDDMSHVTITVTAESEFDATIAGKRYIRSKKQSTMGKYWTNAEIVSVVEAGDTSDDT